MTPAINVLKKGGYAYRVHQFEHRSGALSYGREAAQQLQVAEQQIFKTLLVRLEPHAFAVVLVPVSHQLDLKRLAQAAGVRKAAMAPLQDVHRITGYLPGGVSPVGLKKNLNVLIDEQARRFDNIFISAGKRGVEISLSPITLAKVTHASFCLLCRQ